MKFSGCRVSRRRRRRRRMHVQNFATIEFADRDRTRKVYVIDACIDVGRNIPLAG